MRLKRKPKPAIMLPIHSSPLVANKIIRSKNKAEFGSKDREKLLVLLRVLPLSGILPILTKTRCKNQPLPV